MEFIARLSSPDAPASAVIPNDRIGIEPIGWIDGSDRVRPVVCKNAMWLKTLRS